MRVRSIFLDSPSELLRPAVLAELAAAGMAALEADTCEGGPVIAVLDRIGPEILAFIDAAGQSGTCRIVGVTCHRLADHDIWTLLNRGFSEVVPFEAGVTGRHIAARLDRWAAIERLLNSPAVTRNLIGRSGAWLASLRQAIEAATFSDASVLIMGETGTGKELLARLVHTLDARANKGGLILLDCTTIVPELSGSEFFGHERGAYTGASEQRQGAFALASGGTLFLDEVGELDARLQAQLLRVIQEKTYKPVGGNAWHTADFRLVCATSRDLRAEVEQGRFRADLYFRVASCLCRTVPLSKRLEDIPALVRHFAGQVWGQDGVPALDPAVERYLISRDYPGNVRDLRQLVTRMMVRHAGSGRLTLADVPEDERPLADAVTQAWRGPEFEAAIRKACLLGAGLREVGRAAEEAAVRITLLEEGGKLSRAAARLGVTDRALQMRRSAQRAGPPRPNGTAAG